MKERGWIEPIVVRVVQASWSSGQPRRATSARKLSRRVTEEIAAVPVVDEAPAPSAGPTPDPSDLARAVAEIHAGGSQKEIHRAHYSMPVLTTRPESRSLWSRAAMPRDGKPAVSPIATLW